MRRALPLLIVCLFLAPATAAEIESMDIEYKDGETTLSGYLARPKGVTESRPAVSGSMRVSAPPRNPATAIATTAETESSATAPRVLHCRRLPRVTTSSTSTSSVG